MFWTFALDRRGGGPMAAMARGSAVAPSSESVGTQARGCFMAVHVRRALLVGSSILVTFAALRVYLHLSPGSNLNIGAYNVHHLFTGLLLIAVGGLPSVLFHGDGHRLDLSAIVFGAGLGMALDEWVYLITTDGSDTSYLLPISLWGGIAMVSLALAYLLVLVLFAHRCARASSPRS